MIRISEVFYSIQGEGTLQDIPMVFVRLAGCNLIPHCLYCDTSYAWDPKDGEDWGVESIIKEVTKLSPYYKSWVCLSGGEPLWQVDGLEQLVRELRKGSYRTTVETNGSFKPPWWYSLVDSWNADIKCPSSGVCGVSVEDWFYLRDNDQIKFVVGTKEDLDFARKLIRKYAARSPVVLISPLTGVPLDKKEGTIEEYWKRDWLQEVWEFCKEMRVRFSLQEHKIVHGNRRGV